METTIDILNGCERRVGEALSGGSDGLAARDAALYLAHTERGASIRSLAAAVGTHPSTVMRAVRRVEARRDDPLFDRLISAVGGVEVPAIPADPLGAPCEAGAAADTRPSKPALTLLRRLNEPGAFLMIAPGAEQGGVFTGANRHRKPIALVALATATELRRRDWIAIADRGRTSVRYRITEPGRAALRRALAEAAEAARTPIRADPGFAEAQSPFAAQHALPGQRATAGPDGEAEALAVNLAESPLGWLARRKGADGRPFLGPEHVEAGERLREDFEAAQMGPRVAQDWSRFLTAGARSGRGPGSGPAEGPAAARTRVAAALDALGPGLSDVALRVCCFLEGLETCERRMGWAARSGKVVLRLALDRLVAHYGLTAFRH